jgi:hypothetical protein
MIYQRDSMSPNLWFRDASFNSAAMGSVLSAGFALRAAGLQRLPREITMAKTDRPVVPRLPTPVDAAQYWIDAWQRSILALDVMRRRGEQHREQAAIEIPTVLDFASEMVLDGRTLARPVNYLLMRILPPDTLPADPLKRPFVVVDPRAGHGPGIGGFKADSEIGIALRARHPCYFVGFLPEPEPGQTIEDILHAEAAFLETVIARHPEAEGKPCVVGNCQAGWAMMMVNAVRPELFGLIIVAGSPLSYWAGVRGKYPMRYSGGLLGGSWLTALTSDIGAGVFDGAWLVQNFENQNPANTLWSKQYELYANIDSGAERYLEFEKWWGGHIDLNAEEIQFIVDELFVGNKLASGDIRLSDGTAVDLRNIRSPIVVFCSKADNITPPQQALDWILDLYDDVDDIRRNGQTIVYTVHESAGHLGIFVSGSVARKEHDEFASNIDFLDTLPPGLYEAVLEPRNPEEAGDHLVGGDWIMRCEPRTLDDIRAMGGNDPEDDRRFATAARMSEINLALYRTFAQPFVRAAVTPEIAETLRKMQPLRLSYSMMGRGTPMGAWLASTAASVEDNRKAAAPDNPFLAMQEMLSHQIVEGFEAFRKSSERLAEQTFHAVYGNPVLQTAMGIDPKSDRPPRKAARSLMHEALVEKRIEDLRAAMTQGGLREATARALFHVGARLSGADERSFEAIRRFRKEQAGAGQLPLAEFKKLLREQFFMLLIDEEAALAAIPGLLPEDEVERRKAFALLTEVLTARGPLEGEAAERMNRIADLFGLGAVTAGSRTPSPGRKAAGGRTPA